MAFYGNDEVDDESCDSYATHDGRWREDFNFFYDEDSVMNENHLWKKKEIK